VNIRPAQAAHRPAPASLAFRDGRIAAWQRHKRTRAACAGYDYDGLQPQGKHFDWTRLPIIARHFRWSWGGWCASSL